MVLVPPGAVGLKFWRPDAVDKRTRNAWNVEDKSAGITLSNSDKTATATGNVGVRSTSSQLNQTTGKYYAEFLFVNSPNSTGLNTLTASLTSASTAIVVLSSTGNIFINNSDSGISTGSALVDGDVLCLAWDASAEKIWARKNNGLWNNNAAADPAAGTNAVDASAAAAVSFALWTFGTSGDIVTLCTELADFTYSVPSGFTSWMGETVPVITGVGDLAADIAAISGLGTVVDAEVTGTGALAADAAAVSGAGVSASVGTGTLTAQAATAAGVGVSVSSGTGALAAQSSVVAGTGISSATGIGAIVVAAAVLSGVGTSSTAGTGALAAVTATVTGAGTTSSSGTGLLADSVASLIGVGISSVTGTGALISVTAGVTGAGAAQSADSGVLLSATATVTGQGTSASSATGALASTSATITGVGTSSGVSTVTGAGALVSARAVLFGLAVPGEIVVPPELPETGEGINHIEIYFSAVTGSLAVRRRWPPPAIIADAPPARRAKKMVQLVLEPSSEPDPYPLVPKNGRGVRSIPLH